MFTEHLRAGQLSMPGSEESSRQASGEAARQPPSAFGTHCCDLSVFAYCLDCGLHGGTTWSLLCAHHTEQCLLAYSRYFINICWRFNEYSLIRGENRGPVSDPAPFTYPTPNSGTHTLGLQPARVTVWHPSPSPLP